MKFKNNKKIFAITVAMLAVLMISIICLPLVGCADNRSPEEKLPEEVEKYISENYRITVGAKVSEPVNVDIASVIEKEKNKEWAVLGTYTVKVGNEIMSAKFGLVARYDESSKKFTYSNEAFDDFE